MISKSPTRLDYCRIKVSNKHYNSLSSVNSGIIFGIWAYLYKDRGILNVR